MAMTSDLNSLCGQLLGTMESRIPAFQGVPSIAASSDREKLGVYNGLNATACSFYSSQGTHSNP